jgi:DHA1 family bicyclomycin/chloramphenicol resistance-like MFS transporter
MGINMLCSILMIITAGSASALVGLIQFTLASLSSSAVGLLHNGSAYPMALIMLTVVSGGLLINRLGSKPRKAPAPRPFASG